MRKIIIATFALAAGLVIGVAACEPAESDTTTPRAGVVENAESAPEAPADDLTSTQRNAVRKAESYLEYSAFSESGLVTQLEFEGFDTADAQFAVAHLSPDWMEQAVKKAESYMEYSAFSESGLVDQLEFDGFTPEQAAHGAASQF